MIPAPKAEHDDPGTAGAPLSSGLLFPEALALVVREPGGFLLVASSGMRSHVSGPICGDIAASLAAGAPTPGLLRLVPAHAALAQLAGWLRTTSVPLSRAGAVRLDGFDTLFVELLGRCNERCVHCYADSAPTVEDALDRDVVLSVIDQAKSAGFRRIQFTGGDPLLCDFLPEAVARARQVGLASIEIYTNGLALTDRLLDELAPSRPSFAFSFYSLDPDIHDGITRTPGSQRRTLAAIDRAVARGLSVRAAVVVMEANADGVDDLVAFLRERGVGFVSWSRTFAVGRGAGLTGAGTAHANGAATAEGGGHRAPQDGGRFGHGKLCVTYTGDVVPCIFQRQSVLGNVKSGRTLAEIIEGSGARRPAGRAGLPVAAEVRARLQCSSCRLTDLALAWLGARPAVPP